jgi:predicted nucleic acid-binding protein
VPILLPTRTATLPISGIAAGNWLLDTPPLVALLSRDDAAHAACVAAFGSTRGHLSTSEAVLTEAMHLLGRRPAGSRACLEFFIRPGALLVPTTSARLRLCRDLMARYDDTPMDFADATLVALAEEFGVGHVLTLDRRGFVPYRWRRTRTRFHFLAPGA